MNKEILRLTKINKSYSGVPVLNDVDFDVRQGEVHALVGANGAGKSTLVKIISGATQMTSGEIEFEGSSYTYMNPKFSADLGIKIIYQELMLILNFTIGENIFLGQQEGKLGIFNRKKIEKKAQEIIDVFDLGLSSHQQVRDLSVAYMQIVEIAKALSQEVKLLILDEPTAALSDTEVEILFRIIGELKARGVSIIYISHRLEEIFGISDRVTVLRDGYKIATLDTKATNRKELISLMINDKSGAEDIHITSRTAQEPVLEVQGLTGTSFKDISFTVRAGEVVGLEGLVGSKRTEIARAIFGADRIISGKITLNGQDMRFHHPAEAIKNGVILIPEDRKNQGAITSLPVKWNTTLSILSEIRKWLFVKNHEETEIVGRMIERLNIKLNHMNQEVATLSGGNQQKVVVSKGLAVKPKLIIMDEPTRGIDVGAKREIYALIDELAGNGTAILLITSEIDEMIALADRLVILSEGRVVTELDKNEFEKEVILNYASGDK